MRFFRCIRALIAAPFWMMATLLLKVSEVLAPHEEQTPEYEEEVPPIIEELRQVTDWNQLGVYALALMQRECQLRKHEMMRVEVIATHPDFSRQTVTIHFRSMLPDDSAEDLMRAYSRTGQFRITSKLQQELRAKQAEREAREMRERLAKG